MLDIDIPGFGHLHLQHLVLDFNGTLALDGHVQPGVFSRLSQLKAILSIHILTADTFGTVKSTFASTDYTVHILPQGDEKNAKLTYVRALGAKSCAALGNGNNDAAMLAEAGLSMAVLQAEGAAWSAMSQAMLTAPSIEAALGLLLHPARLKATLRF